MKTKTQSVLIMLLLISLFAFKFPPVNKTKVYEAKDYKSLLWKLSKNGEADSYLFGISQVLPGHGFELPEKVKKAFDKADRLVMALKIDNPNIQAEMMEHIDMKGNKTLYELLSKEDYKKLNVYLMENLGVGIDFFDKFKPAILQSYLIPTFLETEVLSFEELFLELAATNQKEIDGLEQPVDQLSVYDEIPYEDQVKEVMKMVNKDKETSASHRKLASLYKAGDAAGIFAEVQKQFGANNAKFVFENRNKKFIPVIKTFTKSKSTFIAVGSGHLGGKNGLIELLKQAGYTVTPIMY